MDYLQSLRLQFLVHVQPVLRTNPFLKYVLLAQFSVLLVGLVSPLADLLVFVPIGLFRLHLWRLITNLFVETNLIVMVWSVYCFHQFILYIQPNWPLVEVLKYAAIAQFGSLFAMVICTLCLYAFTGLITPFYLAPISGTSALAMAALIALKQFIPDTVLLTTPTGRLKNGHLPFASVLCASALWLFGLLRGTVPFQQIFSAQISWTYLRFFQSRGGMPEPMVGDRSDHFTWASLFPRRAQPLAALLGRLVFRTLRRLGVLRRVLRSEQLAHAEEDALQLDTLHALRVVDASAAVLAPEGWDAERKRQKALRMLNERLAGTSAGAAVAFGTESMLPPPLSGNAFGDGLQGVLIGGSAAPSPSATTTTTTATTKWTFQIADQMSPSTSALGGATTEVHGNGAEGRGAVTIGGVDDGGRNAYLEANGRRTALMFGDGRREEEMPIKCRRQLRHWVVQQRKCMEMEQKDAEQ
uniref:Transmembrane protein n=1 Tax=Globodera pallida TaxID=36090 RepID=A0A183BPE0_GLOPA